jgi:hypothetical protein
MTNTSGDNLAETSISPKGITALGEIMRAFFGF